MIRKIYNFLSFILFPLATFEKEETLVYNFAAQNSFFVSFVATLLFFIVFGYDNNPYAINNILILFFCIIISVYSFFKIKKIHGLNFVNFRMKDFFGSVLGILSIPFVFVFTFYLKEKIGKEFFIIVYFYWVYFFSTSFSHLFCMFFYSLISFLRKFFKRRAG